MYKKIRIYVNGCYEFSTHQYKTCKEAVKDLRAKHCIRIASVPKDRLLTIHDHDKIRASYK